jgi:hypothetical protein
MEVMVKLLFVSCVCQLVKYSYEDMPAALDSLSMLHSFLAYLQYRAKLIYTYMNPKKYLCWALGTKEDVFFWWQNAVLRYKNLAVCLYQNTIDYTEFSVVSLWVK